MDDRTSFAREERLEFVQLLEQLTPQQWEHETLCSRWQVRQVVAHVFSYDELSAARLARASIRGRLSLPRINAICLAEHGPPHRPS